MASVWSKEITEILMKHWAQGISASEIAKKIGRGVTRNAVIGKAHRMKLASRATNRKKLNSQNPSASFAEVNSNEKIAIDEIEAFIRNDGEFNYKNYDDSIIKYDRTALSVLSLKLNYCKWPKGNPGEKGFGFCSKKSEPGLPYCKKHAKLAYHSVRPYRRSVVTGTK